MTSMRVMMCLGLLSMSVGCVSSVQHTRFPVQNKPLENPEQGRIYVVRPSSLGGAIPMKIYDGDQLIGSTGAKGYLCWERDAGKVVLTGKAENTSTLCVDVEKGQVYYVLQSMSMGVMMARNKLELMDAVKGEKALKGCKQPNLSPEKKQTRVASTTNAK